MRRNNRVKIKPLIVLLLMLTIVAAPFSQVQGVSLESLSPSSGTVETTVPLHGFTDNPYTNTSVWFQISSGGEFPGFSGEDYVGYAISDSVGAMSFNLSVPHCVGSDSGMPHFVSIMDGYYGNTSTQVFYVETSRTLITPEFSLVGEPLPITLTIAGGTYDVTYYYEAQVTRPDGLISPSISFNMSPNATGDASLTFSYNDTYILGSYGVTVRETYPNYYVTLAEDFSVVEHINQLPIATIESIAPNPANFSQPVVFSGSGFDPDGYITAYRWMLNNSQILSNSSGFTTSTLSVGYHNISFQVQDNEAAWSVADTWLLQIQTPPSSPATPTPTSPVTPTPSPTMTPTSTSPLNPTGTPTPTTEPTTSASPQQTPFSSASPTATTFSNQTEPIPVPLLLGGTIASCTVAVGGATLWFYNARPSSAKIRSRIRQRKAREEAKENKKKKKKGKPHLVIEEVDVPSCILKSTAYTARLNIKNTGDSDATNVILKAVDNPVTEFKDEIEKISRLEPNQNEKRVFSFSSNDQVRKDIYNLRFQVTSPQVAPQTKNCYLRGGRIALLSDPNNLHNGDAVRRWLQKNSYPFEDIYSAAHLMTELYKFDFIIVAPQLNMPPEWVQNLATYVENSQSLLIIGDILTSDPDPLHQTLGYSQPKYQNISYAQAAVEVCCEHNNQRVQRRRPNTHRNLRRKRMYFFSNDRKHTCQSHRPNKQRHCTSHHRKEGRRRKNRPPKLPR